MGFFTQKRWVITAVAVVAIAMLMGSCFPPSGSKRPLGPLADAATHAPELVGVWELIGGKSETCRGGGDLLLLRADGLGGIVSCRTCEENVEGSILFMKVKTEGPYEMSIGWETDGSVLFVKHDVLNDAAGGTVFDDVRGEVLIDGDFVISENTLQIEKTGDCTLEYRFKARDIKWQ